MLEAPIFGKSFKGTWHILRPDSVVAACGMNGLYRTEGWRAFQHKVPEGERACKFCNRVQPADPETTGLKENPMPISYEYDVMACTCGQDFTETDSIELVISIGGTVSSLATKLTPEGLLVDVDNAVANGYHSQTLCGQCGKDLQDLEDELDMEEKNEE